MVSLVTLITYAHQVGEKYFYTKTEDKQLFKDYLKKIEYDNGIIKFKE